MTALPENLPISDAERERAVERLQIRVAETIGIGRLRIRHARC